MAAERGPRLAEEAANEAVVANHKSSTAWAALGLAQFRLRRRKRAEATLTRALQLDPNDPYAQSAMVTLLQDRRDDASAIALADLLTDTPGTEHVVETIRAEAKKRQLEKKLVERGAMQTPANDPESPRKFGLSLTLGAMMTAGLLALALTQPKPHPVLIAGAFSPLLLFLILRRFSTNPQSISTSYHTVSCDGSSTTAAFPSRSVLLTAARRLPDSSSG